MTWIHFTYHGKGLFIELSDGVKSGKVVITPKELADNDVERVCQMLKEKFDNLAEEFKNLKEPGPFSAFKTPKEPNP
jgi:hypothetical protein